MFYFPLFLLVGLYAAYKYTMYIYKHANKAIMHVKNAREKVKNKNQYFCCRCPIQI